MQSVFLFFVFTVCLLSFLSACREKAPSAWGDREESDDGIVEPSPPVDQKDDPDDITLVTHIPTSWGFEPSEPAPEEPDDSEYATDLYVIAGCIAQPEEHLVTRYMPYDVCENVTIIPTQNSDGDTYEVAAKFTWSVEDPMLFTLEFPLGETNNFAHPIALRDALDADGEEPTSVLHACAHNVCPTPQPEDCAEELCVELPLVAVVDVSGYWLFHSSQHEGSLVHLDQNGRAFQTTYGYEVEDGFVRGTTVSFESGDYQFDGTLTNDGLSMSGTVTELMTLNPAESWFAIRID